MVDIYFIDDKIDEELYKRKSNEYKEIIKNLEGQLNTLELSDAERLETVSHLLNLSRTAYKLFENADYVEKEN